MPQLADKEKILIVDDDAVTRTMIRGFLEKQDYQVLEADSSTQAIEYITASDIQLILMDIDMPDVDGISTCKALSAHLDPMPPIIIITALAGEEMIINSYDAGAADYITKPISWPLLTQKIHFHLQNFRTMRIQRDQIISYEAFLNAAASGFCAVNEQQQIVFINHAALELIDASRNDCVEHRFCEVIHLTTLDGDPLELNCFDFFNESAPDDEPRTIEAALLHPGNDREPVPVECTITPVIQRSRLVGGVVLFQDISERIRQSEEEKHAANHDALTQLPNRKYLEEYLPKAVSLAERQHRMLALLFIDLDAFKPVNDNYGHKVGDKVLQKIGRRLTKLLRNEDTVCRIGGDEFVIILESATSIGGACKVAQKVIEAVNKPIDVDGHICNLGSSIGISLFPDHARDAASLLQTGDIAMYAAKKGGKNKYEIYDPDQQTVLPRWHKLRNRNRLELLNKIFPAQVRPVGR